MRIYVIRHGESEADILNVHEGRADFPLTEKGHGQAARMAKAVAAECRLDKIYCSTLQRARQTAEHLSQETGVALTPMDALREYDNGLLAGLSFEEADRLYPEVHGLPPHQSVYEQESFFAFRFRAENALSRIMSETALDQNIAVVSHGGTIFGLYRAFLRLPNTFDVMFLTGDTGVHCWDWDGTTRRIVYANRTSHND